MAVRQHCLLRPLTVFLRFAMEKLLCKCYNYFGYLYADFAFTYI